MPLRAVPHVYIRGVCMKTDPFLKNERVSYIQADLTKKEECRRAVRGCDYAIMAAASTGGAAVANTEPYRQVTDNLVMDSLMLEALCLEGISRVIYLSSATVYQEFNGYIRENELDWNKDPHLSYIGVGWAKRSVERLCWFWHKKYDLDIIIIRCANIYGPYDKFDPETSNFIPALIRKAVDKKDPFDVWSTADVSRDVLYAEDFATAVVSLLAHSEIKYDIFNLGSGKVVTVGKVVELALKFGKNESVKIIYSKDRPKTIHFRALNCQKIVEAINWKPVIPISLGIEKTTKWWVENRDRWSK